MTNKFKHYYSFCTACGMPLKKYQIAAVMSETQVLDYADRMFVDFDGHFCQECWDCMKRNNLGGMNLAMKKLRNLHKVQRMEIV